MGEDSKNLVFNVNDVLNDSQSSVKLNQTTKGTTWEVKVYNSDPKKAFEVADQLFTKCKDKYGGKVE